MELDNNAMVTPISYIVPAHNEETTLSAIVAAIAERLMKDFPGSEILIVENGSTDGTASVARSLEAQSVDDPNPVSIRQFTSAQGLGHAMRVGVEASSGNIVAMTGGLAFGFSDLDGALGLKPRPPFVIGSKADPNSQLERSVMRQVSTAGFKLIRRWLLNTRIGDSQGSFILNGEVARSLFPLTVEPGYVAQAEVVALAELAGVVILEIPVILRTESGTSSVKPVRTSAEMFCGLLRIRARIPEMRRRVALAGFPPLANSRS